MNKKNESVHFFRILQNSRLFYSFIAKFIYKNISFFFTPWEEILNVFYFSPNKSREKMQYAQKESLAKIL